ncbi:hypothetical protein Cgig2_011791 [Carnegiea gigantea]|uniref:Uncharacterized protein n=1 Tax=Carnegiea gigantea TaxID=171969 RepID=A0A9Q1GW04_9CARY|nr:hypothetical protein Cgig2_011791 [Carnegiea gigantea]
MVGLDMVGETKFVVVRRYRGWSASLDRDRDEYNIMDSVRDAHAFLNRHPLAVERMSQFVSLSSPPNKPSLKWPVNNDNDLMKIFDKWKVDFLQTQAKAKPHGKDVMVNDEDGESDDEDDDEFEGESIGSEGKEGTESDMLESSDSEEFVIDEDQMFDSNSGDDDKWERVKLFDDLKAKSSISVTVGSHSFFKGHFPYSEMRICLVHFMRNFKKLHSTDKLSLLLFRATNAYSSVNCNKAIESLHKESPAAYTWPMEEPIEHWCRHTLKLL